jgi:hypothetical protein
LTGQQPIFDRLGSVAAARKVFGDDLGKVASRFRPQEPNCVGGARVQELAAAVVLSRDHDVPLARLCDALQGDPPRTLVEALKTLRPSFDVPRAVEAARKEARTLLGGRSRR